MKNITLFTVIVFLSACNACKKPASVPNYPTNDSLKAAFNYQIGTYWIYKDSISGEVDSFYVINNEDVTSNVISNYNTGSNYNVESITIKISDYSTLANSITNEYWQYLYSYNSISITYYGQNMHITTYEPFIDYPFQYYFSVPLNASTVITTDSIAIDSIYDSYDLNGLNFSDVAKVNHWYDNNAGTGLLYNDVFYVCPGAGMIKMKLYHPLDSINRVWEIQRWNIVK